MKCTVVSRRQRKRADVRIVDLSQIMTENFMILRRKVWYSWQDIKT